MSAQSKTDHPPFITPPQGTSQALSNHRTILNIRNKVAASVPHEAKPTMTMTSPHLKTLKSNVPSEYATSSRVRQWLLEHLQNRNVQLKDGPKTFVCQWNGAELHSLHPNHIFGSLISQGVASETAHHVVGDIMECLQDYRNRRAACVAAGQVWFPDPEPESQPSPKQSPSQEQHQRLLREDCESLLEQPDSSQSWYSSLTGAKGGFLAAGLSLAVGLGVMTWWLVSPPARKEVDK
ncbi:hypothetical protein CDEST_12073 [Colletotrichum destructivum]|uniref:Uncharacterized protein n=1 Tax=Colletotrichum destructivum TaxID=34406 RepID=A0AAX4IUW2_9PEZI|nr:hypothetical protein CDEST_12073 [Colletotrichum destructivum]